MPRIARKYYNTSFFHVMVQGIRKEDIKLNKEHLKELVMELREKCNLTHQEIADEIGISRVKVTRIINEN